MDIYIEGNLPKSVKDKGNSIKLRIPVLPEAINCKSAIAFASYNILDNGEVKIPNGCELDEIAWESIFPGEGRKGAAWLRGQWTSSDTLVHYFLTWIKYGVKLSLTISGTKISSKQVYVSSFEWKPSGGFGDREYTVSFVQAKNIIVTSKKKSRRSSKAKSTTYIVKKGDTLYKIAKKFYGKGSSYMKIYNANKSVIEKKAKKHGKKSSNKGRWLYAGTKLTIPAAGGSSKKSSGKVTYYPRYKGKSGSITDALKSLKIDYSMSNRKKIAARNNIKNYAGTASQNIKMLSLLKKGKLIKSK